MTGHVRAGGDAKRSNVEEPFSPGQICYAVGKAGVVDGSADGC